MSRSFAVWFVLITVVIDAIGIGLIMPVMPALISELGHTDVSGAAIWGGLLASVFAIMQFLFGPLLGSLSDRFGRRPVLLISLAVMCVDYVIMGFAHSLWLLFIGRVIHGITAANHSTAAAVIADVSKPEDKAANFGLLGAAFGIGFILGPALGGFLSQIDPRAPFFGAAVIAGVHTALGWFFLPETVTEKTRRAFDWRRAHPFGAFRAVGALPGQARMLCVVLFYELSFIVYPAVWAYYTIFKFGWDGRLVGISLACFGLGIAVVQGGLIRWMVPKFGEYRTAIFGLCVDAVAFVAIALVWQGWMVFALVPLTALGAVASPAISGLMSRAVSDDAQGELQGVITSIRAFASITGPLVMTALFTWFTRDGAALHFPGAPFLASLVLVLVAVAVFAGVKRPPRRKAA
ncbi:MAG: TCR/Tet family MFS transporter [Rhodobacteraceae bacterium]|nr:TCR/Tet family MFS transporter [Paracoccaceae bacterium]